MIVEVVKVGNATVRVHDESYRENTKEETEAYIADYCRAVVDSLTRQNIRQTG